MQKKMLFVYHPKSGKAKLKAELSEVLELYASNGYDINIHPTQYSGDAKELVAKRAGEFDLIVCSGGDGTIDEVVEGMIQSGKEVPIGYIPTGTVNDFAASLGLPKDIRGAAATAIDGKPYLCDVGQFGDRHFNYVAAFGIFTDVAYKTPQDVKNLLGKTAYVLEGARDLLKLYTYHMQIEADGVVTEGDYIYGSISNSHSVAGLPVPFHRVDMADGVLEATFIKKPEALNLQSFLEAMITGTPDPNLLDIFRGKQFSIHSAEPVQWTLDGEYGGSVCDVTIEVKPKAVRLMVPNTEE